MKSILRSLGEYTVFLSPFLALYAVLIAVGVHPLVAAAFVVVVELADYYAGSPTEDVLARYGPLSEPEEGSS